MNWVIGGIVLCVLAIAYFVRLFVVAYIETKNAPRIPMHFCPVHGPISDGGTVEFVGVRYCGLCFHQKMKAAERMGR